MHNHAGSGKLDSGSAPHAAGAAAAIALLRSSSAPRWRAAAARTPSLLAERHYTVLSSGTGSNYLPNLFQARAMDAASGHVLTGPSLPALLCALRQRLLHTYELTHADLLQVVSLKHSLMQWRPNLWLFAGDCAATPAEVQRITGDALELLHGSSSSSRAWSADQRLRAALDALCGIHGVGPATAALVCALAAPETACFAVDEALSAWALHRGDSAQGLVPADKAIAHTICALAGACRAKAGELTALEAVAAAAAPPPAALPPTPMDVP